MLTFLLQINSKVFLLLTSRDYLVKILLFRSAKETMYIYQDQIDECKFVQYRLINAEATFNWPQERVKVDGARHFPIFWDS